ncbi:MAG: YihY family inner membrane protein [Rhodospirillales bacterium]|nr:YihY family inner membrane protein [Rhodospirillales bacterium]
MADDTHQSGPFDAIRRFASEAVVRFETERGLALAASLSFSTLLALVPIVALGVAMLAAFPALSGLREDLLAFAFRVLVPEASDRVTMYFNDLVRNSEHLTVLGLIALAAAATLLIATIESALTAIFQATSRRGVVARFLIYWAVLTMAPLLIGASFSLAGDVVAIGRQNAVDAVLEPLAWIARGLPIVS